MIRAARRFRQGIGVADEIELKGHDAMRAFDPGVWKGPLVAHSATAGRKPTPPDLVAAGALDLHDRPATGDVLGNL